METDKKLDFSGKYRFSGYDSRIIRAKYILLFVFLAFFITGCGGDKQPNLILITVDTLRTDHLHTYGYQRNTSPNIDRLAGEGALFESVLAVSPRTTQSMTSLIVGRYPQTTGVRSLWGKLKPQELTLAEILKKRGYQTAGIFSNPVLEDRRLEQGFDFTIFKGEFPALEVNDAILTWVKMNQHKKQPFFLWIHYSDPHTPYEPPQKFRNLFGPDYQGPFEKKFAFVGPDHPQDEKQLHKLSKRNVIYNKTKLSPKELKRIIALYDGEIAYMDMAMGKLLEEFKKIGVINNDTLTVFSADHGESLGDHQFYFDHGDFVYEACASIPLIFHWPGKIKAGQRIKQNISLVDILPTILSLLKIEDPASRDREGRNLAPALLGKGRIEPEPAYTESGECFFPDDNKRRYLQGANGKLRALREDNWKLILTPLSKTESKIELYDLSADPDETKDLAAGQPDRARQMKQKLLKWIKSGSNDFIPNMTEAEKARLRAFGYLH